MVNQIIEIISIRKKIRRDQFLTPVLRIRQIGVMARTTLPVLTVAEVAKTVRVSERTVWRELKAGRLRGTRFGGQWRILKRDLEAYLDERATIPAQAS